MQEIDPCDPISTSACLCMTVCVSTYVFVSMYLSISPSLHMYLHLLSLCVLAQMHASSHTIFTQACNVDVWGWVAFGKQLPALIAPSKKQTVRSKLRA